MPRTVLRGFLLVWLVSMFSFASAVRADGPELVEDIATEPLSSLLPPNGFLPFRGKVLFFGADNDYVPALWISDGTTAGTGLLGLLCPSCAAPRLTVAEDQLFFSADDGIHGRELWRSPLQ